LYVYVLKISNTWERSAANNQNTRGGIRI